MSPTDASTAMTATSRSERRGVHIEIIVLNIEIIVLNQLLTSTTPTMTFLMG